MTVLIEDCLFLENYAKTFGGALYASKFCVRQKQKLSLTK